MICIPFAAAGNDEMLALIRAADAEPADLYELRLDSLKQPPRVEELIAACRRPAIATCRSWREGGGHTGSDAERRAILQRAVKAGAAYLDLEAGDIPHTGERGTCLLIVSLHDFEDTPANLAALVADLAKQPADWVKFAVTATRTADNLTVLDLIAACPKPCIGMAMGGMGLPSRILGSAYGSRLTFGSLESGKESAPGQPTARELAELYRVKELTRDTRVYGLLGNPVAQSRGYVLHNRAFRETGLDAVYIPFLARDADEFFAAMPGGINLHGLSVTIPHKRAALAWADSASEASRRIGAANTLTRSPDGWRADNTDCLAVYEAVKEAVDREGAALAGEKAVLLGAGGTTGAVGVALQLLGCQIWVAARDDDKAARLAKQLGWRTAPWSDAWQEDWRVVANTTPVGMYPNVDDSPFPAEGWRKGMVAFDAVHNPAMTRFLREAEAAGALPVSGEDMFVRQGAGQFKLWTGKTMPERITREFME